MKLLLELNLLLAVSWTFGRRQGSKNIRIDLKSVFIWKHNCHQMLSVNVGSIGEYRIWQTKTWYNLRTTVNVYSTKMIVEYRIWSVNVSSTEKDWQIRYDLNLSANIGCNDRRISDTIGECMFVRWIISEDRLLGIGDNRMWSVNVGWSANIGHCDRRISDYIGECRFGRWIIREDLMLGIGENRMWSVTVGLTENDRLTSDVISKRRFVLWKPEIAGSLLANACKLVYCWSWICWPTKANYMILSRRYVLY